MKDLYTKFTIIFNVAILLQKKKSRNRNTSVHQVEVFQFNL